MDFLLVNLMKLAYGHYNHFELQPSHLKNLSPTFMIFLAEITGLLSIIAKDWFAKGASTIRHTYSKSSDPIF